MGISDDPETDIHAAVFEVAPVTAHPAGTEFMVNEPAPPVTGKFNWEGVYKKTQFAEFWVKPADAASVPFTKNENCPVLGTLVEFAESVNGTFTVVVVFALEVSPVKVTHGTSTCTLQVQPDDVVKERNRLSDPPRGDDGSWFRPPAANPHDVCASARCERTRIVTVTSRQ